MILSCISASCCSFAHAWLSEPQNQPTSTWPQLLFQPPAVQLVPSVFGVSYISAQSGFPSFQQRLAWATICLEPCLYSHCSSWYYCLCTINLTGQENWKNNELTSTTNLLLIELLMLSLCFVELGTLDLQEKHFEEINDFSDLLLLKDFTQSPGSILLLIFGFSFECNLSTT